jgi:hypothetical protein
MDLETKFQVLVMQDKRLLGLHRQRVGKLQMRILPSLFLLVRRLRGGEDSLHRPVEQTMVDLL